MKRGLKVLFRTIVKTVLFLMIITGLGLVYLGVSGLKISELDFDKLSSVRDKDGLKDWYYNEIGEIVVGEAVKVESVSYDKYAYQQLDDTTKEVYDQVLSCVMNMEEKVTLSSKSLSVLEHAHDAVMADYGNLFWIQGYQYNTYKSGEEIVGLEYVPKFTMTKEQRDIYQATIDSTVDEWLSGLSVEATDYEKALYVFETLISKVDYDLESKENQNILSVFIFRSTVCQGYADAAWYMLDRLGIPCTIIRGNANNEPHAWNLIYLDGSYYFMDVTWGNSKFLNLNNDTQKRVNYAYLAMTTEEISQTHIVDMDIEMPECLSNADNYFVHENLYFDKFDPDSIGWTFQKSYESHEEEISLKFSNNDLFAQVNKYFFEESHIADYCKGVSSISYILDDNANVITIQW